MRSNNYKSQSKVISRDDSFRFNSNSVRTKHRHLNFSEIGFYPKTIRNEHYKRKIDNTRMSSAKSPIKFNSDREDKSMNSYENKINYKDKHKIDEVKTK